MKVTVFADRCIGSGSCVIECPEVFDQDDDGIVILLDPEPSDELARSVDQAAVACPTACIEVES